MFQHNINPCDGVGWMHLLTVIAPHVLVVLTTLLNFRTSRSNRRDIKEVKRALNGKADNSEE